MTQLISNSNDHLYECLKACQHWEYRHHLIQYRFAPGKLSPDNSGRKTTPENFGRPLAPTASRICVRYMNVAHNEIYPKLIFFANMTSILKWQCTEPNNLDLEPKPRKSALLSFLDREKL